MINHQIILSKKTETSGIKIRGQSWVMQKSEEMNGLLRVAIVGAGVTGLTAAVHLQDRFPGKLNLAVLADKFTPNTLSDRSLAVLLPTILTSESSINQAEDLKRWACISMNKFKLIFSSADNAQVGLSLVHGFIYFSSPEPQPWWKDLMFGSRQVEMKSAEANMFAVPTDCEDIWAFGTFTLNPTSFLQWLMGKAKEGGCVMEERKISSLEELTSSYDIVINCTGLSSYELVPDKSMYPVQGQLVLVKAPWIKHWVVYPGADGSHSTGVIPRGSDVILGTTHVNGNWNDSTDPDTTTDIIKRCQDLVPSLCGAEVVGSWAGLRPGRDTIRLECCKDQSGNLVIHCYGHKSSGVFLSWGCASDIGDMVEQKLATKEDL